MVIEYFLVLPGIMLIKPVSLNVFTCLSSSYFSPTWGRKWEKSRKMMSLSNFHFYTHSSLLQIKIVAKALKSISFTAGRREKICVSIIFLNIYLWFKEIIPLRTLHIKYHVCAEGKNKHATAIVNIHSRETLLLPLLSSSLSPTYTTTAQRFSWGSKVLKLSSELERLDSNKYKHQVLKILLASQSTDAFISLLSYRFFLQIAFKK